MLNSNISLFLLIGLTLFYIFLSSCANPQPPSGGPVDKTPPEIIGFYPANQTVNFDKRVVRLEFNKYMDKPKVVENISISPLVPIKFDWSGKNLEIELPNEMDSTVTYSINIGTDYTDLYNNKPANAFSLIFSTGSKIDSGYISGKVYDNSPEGAYIFCYMLNNINPDTLNPSATLPDYKIQLGSSGEFRIPALKDAVYRIFVLRDQFKNGLYEPVDAYGSGVSDLVVTKAKSNPTILKIGTVIDKSGPILSEVNSINVKSFYAKFNEIVNRDFIYPESFELVSEDNQSKVNIKSAWQNFENNSRVDFTTEIDLDTSKVWVLKCKTIDPEFTIRDTTGNLILDSLSKSRFRVRFDKDTSTLMISYLPLRDSSEYINVSTVFDLLFDKALDTSGSDIKILLSSSNNIENIPIKHKINGNMIRINPDKVLADNQWFKLSFELKNIKSQFNNKKMDTSFIINFKTIDFKVRGSVSGIVQFDGNLCEFKKYLVLKHKNGKDIYTTELNDKFEWSFKNIETGDYIAELFCDTDENGKYSFGDPFPFKFAEPFVSFSEEIRLKPRWLLENIILKVKDSHGH